jgi:hypothetical protein
MSLIALREREHSSELAAQCRVRLDGTARLRIVRLSAALPSFVHLSSERTLEPVREDRSFASDRSLPLRSWSSSRGRAVGALVETRVSVERQPSLRCALLVLLVRGGLRARRRWLRRASA